MIAGFVADLPVITQLLAGEAGPATEAMEAIADEGDTVLVPVTVLIQAAIIMDPPPEQFMWLYGFRAIQVANLDAKDAFPVVGQARFAPRPYEIPTHQAHTAHLATSRGWPILTADPAGWLGYEHLELVHL